MSRPARRVTRRQVMLGGVGVALPAALGCTGQLSGDDDPSADQGAPGSTDGGEPPSDGQTDAAGPNEFHDANAPITDGGLDTRGVVAAVSHAKVLEGGLVDAAAVREMMNRGMRELTGLADDVAAWRSFFSKDDVVAIKVSPVGYPKAFSQLATVSEIVHGLALAGVPHGSIVIFERYGDILAQVGYAAALPAGVRLASAVATYTEDQTGTDGYDPDAYVDLPRVYPGDDPASAGKRRSCLARVLSRDVTKIVNVPALKDHISAGITFALKNITYGCVSNVSRSHPAPDNWTRDFLPAVLSMKQLRDKVVLHIGDALVACYAGGPGPPDTTFATFEPGTLLFATDPVAMDRIGWEMLDAKRVSVGLPKLAECGLKKENRGLEAFDERQPDHVFSAGNAGFGVADRDSIRLRAVSLG